MTVWYLNNSNEPKSFEVTSTTDAFTGAPFELDLHNRHHREALVDAGVLMEEGKKQSWIPPHRILRIDL